jgi:hypothetical protein
VDNLIYTADFNTTKNQGTWVRHKDNDGIKSYITKDEVTVSLDHKESFKVWQCLNQLYGEK